MKTVRMGVAFGAVLVGMAWLPVQPANATNTPTFRDCSFTGGLDPDFVELSGAAVDSHGMLDVTPTQNHVTMKASESADPGDSSGHVMLTVTVNAPSAAPKTLSGTGTGHVVLSVPLSGAAVGSAYTISWSATFDNGNHACPSSVTPQNKTSRPFVLHVVTTLPTPTSPMITHTHQSHRVWRERGASPPRKHKPPVGTRFFFTLNEPARVSLAFTQRLRGRRVNGRCVRTNKQNHNGRACKRVVTRGTLSVAGLTGGNHVSIKGRIGVVKKLKPGRYRLVISATNATGQRSPPRFLSFTISR